MIKNDSNFMVNNFLLINVDDDAIYIAKSKEDVLDYWKKYYGTPMEIVGETDEEFLDALEVMDLTSDEVHKIREWWYLDYVDEQPKSYYDVYLQHAEISGVKCEPILWYNL